MFAPDPALDRIADAIIDGESISWDEAVGAQDDGVRRGAVEQFRALVLVRGLNRALGDVLVQPQWRTPTGTVAALAGAKMALIVAAALWAGLVARSVPHAPGAQLIVMSSFAVAAAWLFLSKPLDTRSKALGAVYAMGAVAFANPLLRVTWEADPTEVAGFLRYGGVYPEAFLAAAFWSFAVRFPDVHRFTTLDAVGRGIERLVWVLSLGLFGVNIWLAWWPAGGSLAFLERLQRTHPSETFWFMLSVPSAAAVALIVVRSFLAEGEERKRVRRFAWSLLLTCGPFFLHALGRLAWPPLNRWFATAGSADLWFVNGLMLTGLALFAPLTALCVVADRALSVVVARATQRALAGRLIALLAFAPAGLLVAVVYRMRSLPLAAIFADRSAQGLGILTLVGLALIGFRRSITMLIDRLFGQRSSDRVQEFRKALERAHGARGVRELIFLTSKEAREALQVSFATVLTPSRGTLSSVFGAIPIVLPLDSAVGAVLTAADEFLDVSPSAQTFALLPRAERAWLTASGVHGVTPVRGRDGQLLAALATGHRVSGLPFGVEDRWMVQSMAQVLGIAWRQTEPDPLRHDVESGARELHEAAFECPRCGSVSPTRDLPCSCGVESVPAALPAMLQGKFRLVRRLGRGGMGIVYLATDVALGREVAIKTLPFASAEQIAHLRAEAQTMATLDHPGLATLFGIEMWYSTPALIVEYFAAGTLAQQLGGWRGQCRRVVQLGIELTDTLVYLHDRGLAHCDIKPSNIGMSANQRSKLLDFGLAGLLAVRDSEEDDPSLDSPARIFGTPIYMPPEARAGNAAGVHRDLWAVSMTVLEGLCGRHPFVSGLDVRVEDLDRAMEQHAVPLAVAVVLRRALARDPAARFGDARTLRDALEACVTTMANESRGTHSGSRAF